MRLYEYIQVGSLTLEFESFKQSENLISIQLAEPVSAEVINHTDFGSFAMYTRGGSKIGNDITGYSTVYRYHDSLLQLSNDGSIYIEPKEHEYIKANGGDPIDVESVSVTDTILTITLVEAESGIGDDLINKEIIHYSKVDAIIQTYTGFNTVYRENGAVVELSNDGSEYDPDEEAERILNEAKAAKISAMSEICEQQINAGVNVEIRGVSKHFRFTAEDQQNIKAAFDLCTATKMSVPYHADNETCQLYTPEEIVSIYVAEQVNLTHNQTYFNQLKQYIQTLTSMEAVEAIEYGQPLTGIYLETYNAMMAQTQAIINAIINSVAS